MTPAAINPWGALWDPRETARFGKLRQLSESETLSRMEEEARKLLEEGIRKKLVSPGKGEVPTFANGTKVQTR